MVNRVLIRIKVVQILYSYLLTRSEFKIEPAPESISRDARYAYNLYVNTLLLILELSGYGVTGTSPESPLKEANHNKYLKNNHLSSSLSSNDTIRRIILKGNTGIEAFSGLLEELYDDIIHSSAYRSYTHSRSRDIATDVKFWATIVSSVIARSEAFKEVCRSNELFTLRGFDRGIKLVLDTLTNFSDNRSLITEARHSLERSLDKAYELYHSLLLLPIAITRVEEERLEAGRNKYLPTADDLNPNTKFVDNAFVKALDESPSLKEYLKANPVSWDNEPMLVRGLLDSILKSEVYKEYMEKRNTTFEEDCELWRSIMRTIILPSDELAEVLESSSVYWNDDLEIMGTFALKTIKQFASAGEDGKVAMLPKFKDEEDSRFGAQLFDLAVEHREEYREYIDRFINQEQWDTERLAFMDIVTMITAIAEILNFPLIPIPVTLNEYIEIANCYSTPKSGQFINGILYSVVKYLKAEGLLDKQL